MLFVYAYSTMEEQKEFAEERKPEKETIVFPVMEEQITVHKEIIDTQKVVIRKRVTEEETTLNVPLVHEGYQIEHIPINKIVATPPSIRQEGDKTIIPVIREVLVVEKRYELVEEVHVIKQRTAVPHIQEITLRKEQVVIEHKPLVDNQQ